MSLTLDWLILIELNKYSPFLIPSFGSKCTASSSDDCETKNEFNKFAFSISSTTIVSLIVSYSGGMELEEEGEIKPFRVFHQSCDEKDQEHNLSDRESIYFCLLFLMRSITSFLAGLNF